MVMYRKLSLLLILAFLLNACRINSESPSITPAPTALPATTLAPTAPPTLSPTPTPTPQPEGFSWWNETEFYEVFVRSFLDSDGDGNGDFGGLISKLDYLNDNQASTTDDLGITGVWLMPIFPSPSYHGYDVTDYTSINPDYGTMEDFKIFLEEAHQRGIKVILDMPLNHTSSAHPWFKKALEMDPAYRDYYIWAAEDPVYPGPWGQDVWHKSLNGDFYYGVYWSEMPDLNYQNPAVVEEIKNVFKFWIELGVDGFRLDGARHIIEEGMKQVDTPSTHRFFKDLRTFVKNLNPEILLIGEVWADRFTASTYIKSGDELDLIFDFDLATGYLSSAKYGNAGRALNALKFTQRLFPGEKSASFLTNHDMDRIMSELGGDIEKAKNAAFMLLTGPGVVFLYYGEEIGMEGKRGDEDTDINRRLPMQWTGGESAGFTTGTPWAPVHPAYLQNNVEASQQLPGSLLSLYRELLRIRPREMALGYGDVYLLNAHKAVVYAVLRSTPNENILILMNLSDKPVTDYRLSLDKGPLSGSYELIPLYGSQPFADINANPQGGFDAFQPIPTLSAYSRYIYKLIPQK